METPKFNIESLKKEMEIPEETWISYAKDYLRTHVEIENLSLLEEKSLRDVARECITIHRLHLEEFIEGRLRYMINLPDLEKEIAYLWLLKDYGLNTSALSISASTMTSNGKEDEICKTARNEYIRRIRERAHLPYLD